MFVLTNTVIKQWDDFRARRPMEDIAGLHDLVEDIAAVSHTPEGYDGKDTSLYQHPDFKSVYFLCRENADREKVIVGLKTFFKINGKHQPKNGHKWDELPEGLSDQEIIAWCRQQNAIANSANIDRKCSYKESVERMAVLASIRTASGMRIQKSHEQKRVENKSAEQKGRNKEYGEIINFIDKYMLSKNPTLQGLVENVKVRAWADL